MTLGLKMMITFGEYYEGLAGACGGAEALRAVSFGGSGRSGGITVAKSHVQR